MDGMPGGRLFAISDLHVGDKTNAAGVASLPPHADDWLIVAGDVGESETHLRSCFDMLAPKFAKLIWVPGNHELWTVRDGEPRGQARYEWLVAICREHGVVTPEDPYPRFGGCAIVPMFLLYDYSFRPAEVAEDDAVAWAAESGIMCADERLLDPRPYASRPAWCAARCEATARRIEAEVREDEPTVLVNHFPLRRELARTPAVPRFSIWCGTERTRDWHTRFRARAVVTGHLHMRSSRVVDGVRFEEVSLGYARDWSRERGADSYLREIRLDPIAPTTAPAARGAAG